MSWKNDTLVPEAQQQIDEDPHKTATGKPDAPGGGNAPEHTQRGITYGAENGPDNRKSDPSQTVGSE